MRNPTDIEKVEVKKVKHDYWQFTFRKNGYVIIKSRIDTTTKEERKKGKKSFKWYMHLHGVDVETCLQYIFKSYNGSCDVLIYDELETIEL